MKVLIKSREGYKARIFQNVSFPILVEATPIKRGMLKGWITVTAKELDRVGCDVSFNCDLWSDCEFEFSPNTYEVIE